MVGSYCKFCGFRCFVLRWVPGRHVQHWATCERGAALDRERSGFDHVTAFNPLAVRDETDDERAERYRLWQVDHLGEVQE